VAGALVGHAAVGQEKLREGGERGRVDQRGQAVVRLDLSRNPVGDAGARIVASAPLTRLLTLNLYETQVGDDGLAALVNSPSLAALTELLLPDGRVTDEGARHLLASPRFSALTRLDLRLNPAIREPARRALREAAARVPGLTLEL
ncbi:MAG: hypothetical protein EOO74_05170, partial [Myxococcales bacterium]